MSAHDNVIGADVVERFWPYDGPVDAELLGEAGSAVSGLVRFLNNKTRSASALPYASDLDRIATHLWVTSIRLDQLLGQLSARAEVLSTEPGVYDDRCDRPGEATAFAAAEALARARGPVAQLAAALQEAHTHTTHLGGPNVADPGDGGGW